MEMNSIALIALICGIMTILIAVYAWRQGKAEGARTFSLLMVSMAVYIIGYGLELSSLYLSTILFWNKFQYIGILTFPVLSMLFSSQFSGRKSWMSKGKIALLFVIPFVCLIIKFFDDSLRLIYQSVTLDTSGYIPLLSFTKGPVYYVVAAYSLVTVALGMYMLLSKRPHASSLYRRQTNIILAASVIMYSTFLIYLSGVNLFPNLKQLDINPFVYSLWGFAIGYAILRYRLFDLAPIAREALIEKLGDGVLVLDDRFRLVDSNPKALSICGWEKTPVGSTLEQQNLNIFDQSVFQSLDGEVCFESQIKTDGTLHDYEVTASRLRNQKKSTVGYLLLLHDITRRKRAEKELHELSLKDDLTQLVNRRGFFVLAEQLCGFCSRMSMNAVLFFFDLDNLKQINDHFGHAAGDLALVDMAQILKDSFRSSDIVARFGGDEFVVLAIETAKNTEKSMIKRLDQQLKTSSLTLKRDFELSFSVGTSNYQWQNPQSVETLLKESDQAMYVEKNAKRSSQSS